MVLWRTFKRESGLVVDRLHLRHIPEWKQLIPFRALPNITEQSVFGICDFLLSYLAVVQSWREFRFTHPSRTPHIMQCCAIYNHTMQLTTCFVYAFHVHNSVTTLLLEIISNARRHVLDFTRWYVFYSLATQDSELCAITSNYQSLTHLLYSVQLPNPYPNSPHNSFPYPVPHRITLLFDCYQTRPLRPPPCPPRSGHPYSRHRPVLPRSISSFLSSAPSSSFPPSSPFPFLSIPAGPLSFPQFSTSASLKLFSAWTLSARPSQVYLTSSLP